MRILAIDPGNEKSAYVVLYSNLKPLIFGIVENNEFISILDKICDLYDVSDVAIEMIASYGMPVGREVFDTCLWIGRFYQEISNYDSNLEPKLILRKDIKINLCHSTKAKDSKIRQALLDRFGIVGTKKEPGWFYKVSKDVWAAIAVGVTYSDLMEKDDNVK
jgi:hypothetical protein